MEVEEAEDAGEGGDEGERRIWSRVRRTSCGYVASEATILEKALHMRIVPGEREE